MTRYACATLCGVVLAMASGAGEFNGKLSIGDQAPAWSKLPGTDGKEHSLEDLKAKDVVVVCFTCNHCPIAVHYEDRLIAFARKYAGPDGKVGLVAINVNLLVPDRMDRMKERARDRGFNFPYLFDESQKIGLDYGVAINPQFFVLGKDRTIVYMGRMDDNEDEKAVKTRYLEEAVRAALKGEKPARTETAVKGCRIKYERK